MHIVESNRRICELYAAYANEKVDDDADQARAAVLLPPALFLATIFGMLPWVEQQLRNLQKQFL